MSRPQRAAPMTADARRAAILSATVPLLRTRGMNITTRELAEAAGVAEGTLFRVFPDKEALVRAAVAHALDPAPLVAELDALDPDLDLPDAVERAVDLMIARSRDVVALLSVSYGAGGHGHHGMHHGPAADGPASHERGGEDGAAPAAPRARGHLPPGHHHPVEAVTEAVTALLTRHGGADRLRRDPAVCGRLLVAIVLVSSRSAGLGGGSPLRADEIVDLFLNGALTPAPRTAPPLLPLVSTSEEPC